MIFVVIFQDFHNKKFEECKEIYYLLEEKLHQNGAMLLSKTIGKSENSQWIGEAFCQVIEGLLTIVIDNGFRKCDKSCTVIVYLLEGRVTKVNCWVVSRATTSVQKSIPTETCSEIAVSLISFSSSGFCAALYSIRRILVPNINYLNILLTKWKIYITCYYIDAIYIYLSLSKIVEFVREILSSKHFPISGQPIYLSIEIAFYRSIQSVRQVLKSKADQLSWKIYWDVSRWIGHLNTRRIASAFPLFRPVASIGFGLINYSAWRVDREQKSDYLAVHEKKGTISQVILRSRFIY